jgi:phage/plasmid-associated DNA primase
MDFDPEEGELGLWNDVADRMSNWPAFLAWLGSLFDPSSNREQFIWICGEGATGKSTIVDTILECFGCSALVTTCEAVEDKWFISELEGKRLAHIDEASAKFMRGHKVKSMTGNGKQRCEAKFKAPRTININTKFIFTSNDFPDVQAKKEYTRRIILCEIEAIKDRTMTREEAEAGYKQTLPCLFHRAIRAYKAHSASGSFAIDSDQGAIQEYAGSSDDNADRLFRKFFKVEPDEWVPAAEIYEKLETMQMKSYEIKRLTKEWQRLFGIKPKQNGAERKRGYVGMRRISW